MKAGVVVLVVVAVVVLVVMTAFVSVAVFKVVGAL